MKNEIDFFPLSVIEETIARHLLANEYSTYDRLIFEVYAYNEPEYARASIGQILFKLRRKLEKQGFKIISNGGGRGNKAKLKLVRAT